MLPKFREPAVVVKDLDQWAIGFIAGFVTSVFFMIGFAWAMQERLH